MPARRSGSPEALSCEKEQHNWTLPHVVHSWTSAGTSETDSVMLWPDWDQRDLDSALHLAHRVTLSWPNPSVKGCNEDEVVAVLNSLEDGQNKTLLERLSQLNCGSSCVGFPAEALQGHKLYKAGTWIRQLLTWNRWKSAGLKSLGEQPHQSTMFLYWHLQPSLRFQLVMRRLLSTMELQWGLFSRTVWKKDCENKKPWHFGSLDSPGGLSPTLVVCDAANSPPFTQLNFQQVTMCTHMPNGIYQCPKYG